MKPSRTARWAALSVSAVAATTIATLAPAQAVHAPVTHAGAVPTAAHTGTLDPKAHPFLANVHDLAVGRAAYFVQLKGATAAEASARNGGNARGAQAALDRKASIESTAKSVLASARTADAKASPLFTITNAMAGTGLMLDPAGVAKLASNPNVVKISRVPTHTVNNANVAHEIRADDTWKFNGNTGRGVRVGIIDTGIDYTHADFGGPGTVASYQAALADDTAYNWRSRLKAKGQAKVVGGYDFAGDDYQADPNSPGYDPVPAPDPDPLDCNEHGTHVAGTVAGYGVTGSGTTFSGAYKDLDADKLLAMDIGPGMAPNAQLYGLRVFGCTGSTNLVMAALDYSLDPNGDGNFDDHLDIVNMSLGSGFSPVDNPENDLVDKLAQDGVLSVISMGNDGDLTDAGGEPGTATSSIAVASSVDALQQRDGLKVNAPGDDAGIAAGQMSVAYDWPNNGPTHAPVTGDVVEIGSADDVVGTNADGCDPLSAAQATAVAGKVAWLEWDDNDATRRCGSAGRAANVRAAGAIGAIFTSGLDVFGAGITGSAFIPVFQIPKAQTDKLRPAADAGTLNVTFDGALQATIKDITPSIADTLSSFSSRGPHGSTGSVKPDVTAVGDTVSSAGVGTGNKVLTISGTSMAAPVTTGTSALVKAAHPTWTPLEIKTAVMNNATHDLYTGDSSTGSKYSPARVGAGRVDAHAAVNTTTLAWTSGANNPVSASFGVVSAPINGGTVTKTKNVFVKNLRPQAHDYSVSVSLTNRAAGVAYTVSPATQKIGPGKTAKFVVTMKVDPTLLRHTIDPTMDATQPNVYYGDDEARQFVSDASGRILVKQAGHTATRVPVYGAAKPASVTTTTLSGNDLALTGAGFDEGATSADYSSIASVLELGATSPKLPACTTEDGTPDAETQCASRFADKGADLQYVGAGATADTLTFGLSTYGSWANIGTAVIPYVDYDVDGDGTPDYETYLQNIDGTDLLYAWTVDFDGGLYDLEPVNLENGDVDTNVFDTRVVTMTAFKAAFPEGTDFSNISYQVGMFSAFSGADVDDAPAVTFNGDAPTVSVSDPLVLDQGGTTIPLTGTRATAAQALVLHFHGVPGSQAEVVDVPAATPVKP